MLMSTSFIETLVATSCARCGVSFGLTSSFEKKLRDNHAEFFCPNGHPLHFPGPSPADLAAEEAKRVAERAKLAADNLRMQLSAVLVDRNQTRLELRRAENRERRVKHTLKKAEARVHAGVCPYCNRTFQALARHMKTKHPKGEK